MVRGLLVPSLPHQRGSWSMVSSSSSLAIGASLAGRSWTHSPTLCGPSQLRFKENLYPRRFINWVSPLKTRPSSALKILPIELEKKDIMHIKRFCERQRSMPNKRSTSQKKWDFVLGLTTETGKLSGAPSRESMWAEICGLGGPHEPHKQWQASVDYLWQGLSY